MMVRQWLHGSVEVGGPGGGGSGGARANGGDGMVAIELVVLRLIGSGGVSAVVERMVITDGGDRTVVGMSGVDNYVAVERNLRSRLTS